MRFGHAVLLLAMAVAAAPNALADDRGTGFTVSTLITTPLVIEGLTNDDDGNLYAPGRNAGAGVPCPIYRIALDNPTLTIVGHIPAPSPTTQCSPSGLAFDSHGVLYVTQGDSIFKLTPGTSVPLATLFASGVPGTNGVAFDRNGNLWTGDGTTGKGRVWRISPAGVVTEMFRIPPMSNEVNLVAGVGGVGRDVRTLPPGTITVTETSRNAANTAGSQALVANGLAFDNRGYLYIADTARGAIWRVFIRNDGTPGMSTGCDTTYTANTLCMDHVWVAHPFLEGADGIALDRAGNIWVSANERNALVVVFNNKKVYEAFRNLPDPVTKLRNTGPLETPTSPVVAGNKVCTANSDGNRRDNSPSTAGAIGGPNASDPKGKITCIDQRVTPRGMDLPVD